MNGRAPAVTYINYFLDGEIRRMCRAHGASDTELVFWGVRMALNKGDDPEETFAAMKRNRPDLFYPAARTAAQRKDNQYV